MDPSFNQWQKTFAYLLTALRHLLEEELQSLLLSTPIVFKKLQVRKAALLQAYTQCLLEGKVHGRLLKALPQAQKEDWLKEVAALQALADRNVSITQNFMRDLQQSFALFHKWLNEPVQQGPYRTPHSFSLGLDRRM